MRNGLINRAGIRVFAGEVKPGLTISAEYFDVLEEKVRLLVVGHIRVNNSKGTLKADVLLGVPAGPGRRK